MVEIVGRSDLSKHGEQIAGDGNLFDRRGEFPPIDDEAGGAPAIIAGNGVDTLADQPGDVEAMIDLADQLPRTLPARSQMNVGRPCPRRAATAARVPPSPPVRRPVPPGARARHVSPR